MVYTLIIKNRVDLDLSIHVLSTELLKATAGQSGCDALPQAGLTDPPGFNFNNARELGKIPSD